MLTYAAVAGATAADEVVTAEGMGTSSHWSEPEVSVATGDTVTWSFAAATHNIVTTNEIPTDPRWAPFEYPDGAEVNFTAAPVGATVDYTFYKAGTYTYFCIIHGAGMSGTVTVTGEDQEIPTGTATPTATATATATATPSATPTATSTPPPTGGMGTTPPPASGASADTTAPALSKVSLKGKPKKAKITFTLTENATVTAQLRRRGSRKVLRSASVQARAGKRTIKVSSRKLRKGRYTVSLTARDAMGNRSDAVTASGRLKK
jgi:plastocyanin